ncbi:MAG: glycine zipper 2TM domain-containing protein [Alphaproteobacteria bacterium]|nr:glycine zipper 2TM domain-containing protein [Alphaproteobacteria bacterium]
MRTSFIKFVAIIILGTSLSACSATAGTKETFGSILGGVGGAVAGAQFGEGTGRTAATAAGTLLGSMIGGEVGSSLDRADNLYARRHGYGRGGYGRSYYYAPRRQGGWRY